MRAKMGTEIFGDAGKISNGIFCVTWDHTWLQTVHKTATILK